MHSDASGEGRRRRVLTQDKALPLADCKWQSKFTLAVEAEMEPDSFVGEFERLSGRAGIGVIPSLSSPNRRRTLVEPPRQENRGAWGVLGKAAPKWYRYGDGEHLLFFKILSEHLSKWKRELKRRKEF